MSVRFMIEKKKCSTKLTKFPSLLSLNYVFWLRINRIEMWQLWRRFQNSRVQIENAHLCQIASEKRRRLVLASNDRLFVYAFGGGIWVWHTLRIRNDHSIVDNMKNLSESKLGGWTGGAFTQRFSLTAKTMFISFHLLYSSRHLVRATAYSCACDGNTKLVFSSKNGIVL